jgi:hypothetical protein
MTAQVRSKQRVADHGEVLTGSREVNAMLDLVKHETERIDSRFLEPACGDGNFLSVILERKLAVVEKRHAMLQSDYERHAVLAVSSVYGIDILDEGFRNLNEDIETIINKSDAVKKARKEANDEKITAEEKRELTEEEKEYKTKRKQIQEKLMKFATRIPIFMYLTDYRERCLRDVITQLEPGLFKSVTNLEVADFDRLVHLGLFNAGLMNDAVFKFKRYEDSSLSYTGINKHEGEDIGLYDTVISRKDAPMMFENMPASENYEGAPQT